LAVLQAAVLQAVILQVVVLQVVVPEDLQGVPLDLRV
jgi:hypothetical protein